MRNSAIEIEIDINLIPENIQKELDIEYWKQKEQWTLWIHRDGFKPFLKEYFQHMNAVISVYNRLTITDHLNIYIEVDEIDEYGIDTGEIKYKQLTWTELKTGQINLNNVLLRKELII